MKVSEKKYGYVILVRNSSSKPSKMTMNFSRSKNIRIKGEELRKGKYTTTVKGESCSYLEIAAENTREAFELASFEISQS